MALPGLVDSDCVVCRAKIEDRASGAFCRECGNPVHLKCENPGGVSAGEGRCVRCGGELDGELATRVRNEREQLPPRDDKANPPLADVCPNCGHSQYRKVKARRTVAFVADRICKACETRYAPPTPRWAAVVFCVAGGLLALVGAGALVIRLMNPGPAPAIGACFEIVLAVMGVAAFTYGVRTLMSPESSRERAATVVTRRSGAGGSGPDETASG